MKRLTVTKGCNGALKVRAMQCNAKWHLYLHPGSRYWLCKRRMALFVVQAFGSYQRVWQTMWVPLPAHAAPQWIQLSMSWCAPSVVNVFKLDMAMGIRSCLLWFIRHILQFASLGVMFANSCTSAFEVTRCFCIERFLLVNYRGRTSLLQQYEKSRRKPE